MLCFFRLFFIDTPFFQRFYFLNLTLVVFKSQIYFQELYTPDSPSLCAIYPILLPSSISSPFLLPCHFKEHPYLHCYIFFRFFFALQRISMPNYIFHTFFSLLFFSDSVVTYSQQESACNLIIRQLFRIIFQ